jgi:hypothetical protein
LWLLFACVSGIVLAALPMSETTLRLALLYGAFGLVGFLAQIIIGFEQNILPIVAGYWGLKPARRSWGQACSSGLWLLGVPAIGSGLFFNSPSALAAGAWLLFTATVITTLDVVTQLGCKGN